MAAQVTLRLKLSEAEQLKKSITELRDMVAKVISDPGLRRERREVDRARGGNGFAPPEEAQLKAKLTAFEGILKELD
jgi:hypothetical protein